MDTNARTPPSVLHYKYRPDVLTPSSYGLDPRPSHPSLRRSSSSSLPQTRPPPSQYAPQPQQPQQDASRGYNPPLQAQPRSHSHGGPTNPQDTPVNISQSSQRGPPASNPHSQHGQVVPYDSNVSRPLRTHPATSLLAPLISALDAHATELACALEAREARIAALECQLSRSQHDAGSERAQLENKCAEVENRRVALANKCTVLEYNYASLVPKLSSLEKKHATLETKHASLQTQHSTPSPLVDKSFALEKDYATLAKKYSALENKYSKLQTAHTTLTAKYSTLETTHSTLQIHCTALEGQRREPEAGGTWAALVSVQTENARLRALLAPAGPPVPVPVRRRVRFARGSRGEEDEDELADDEIEEGVTVLREDGGVEEGKLEDEDGGAKRDLVGARRDLESVNTDLDRAKREHAGEKEGWARKRVELEARVQGLQVRVEGLESANRALEEGRERLLAESARLGLQHARLVSDHAKERKKFEDEQIRLKDGATRLEEEKVRLEREMRRLEDEKQRLEDDTQRLQSDKGLLEDDKKQHEANTMQLKDTIKQLEENYKRLEAESAQHPTIRADRRLVIANRAYDALRADNLYVVQQLLQAENALADVRGEMRRMEEAKGRLVDDNKRLGDDTNRLQNENWQLEDEKKQHEAKAKSFEDTINAANKAYEALRADSQHAARQLLEAENVLADVRAEMQRLAEEKLRLEKENRARTAEHVSERARLMRQLEATGLGNGEIQARSTHSAARVRDLPPSSPPAGPMSSPAASRASSPSPFAPHVPILAMPRTLYPFGIGATPVSPPRSSSPAVPQHRGHPSLPPKPAVAPSPAPSPRKRSRAVYEAGSADADSARPTAKARVSPPKAPVKPVSHKHSAAISKRTPLAAINGNAAPPRKLGISHLGILYETVGDRMRCRMCLPGTHFGVAAAAPWGELVGHALAAHPDQCAELLKLGPGQVVERRQRLGLGKL
ncbi:hypothetical protein DFH09DRAFT_1305466 [Mycena vulgaris]|nr:hypothetical protein DFH09DRAFT_1305466 [Mycena vulgaris]